MKTHTSLPWHVDRTYPHCPAIHGADGTHVNVDFQDNGDSELIVDAVNNYHAPAHYARFELRQDEDTGRLYWWGHEDGWKDATEVGENGVITISCEHFKVGTVLHMIEPVKP